MEDQGRGIKVEVRGSRSGEGSRLWSRSGVKVGGRVKVWGVEVVVKVGSQDRRRGHGWGGLGRGQGLGVKVVVKVGGQGRGVKVRGMIGGHNVGVSVGVKVWGSMSGVNVWGRGHGQGDEGQGLESWG